MARNDRKETTEGLRRPGLKPDDEALFMSAMQDVQRPAGSAREDIPVVPEVAKTAAPQKANPAREMPFPKVPKKLSPLATGRSGDVDGRTLDKLRRGKLRPQARLDLHGMTQDQAHTALVSFMANAQADGKRCVIVITGRGRISGGGGVLRNETPRWLNSPAVRSRVLAFATAQPRDGGSGALYVLLRRVR
jgi:DNA-nicking Smr family endonuclease